jgi:alanine racemase
MFSWLESVFNRKYYPLNRIEISSSKLKENYRYLLQKFPGNITPVLKSNAYGHGLIQIASILDPLKPAFFCVDSLFEAYGLYKANIRTPILIMGYIHPESLRIKKLPFSYAVSTIENLIAIKKYQPHAPIHIFVDTGMHREGVMISELPDLLKKAQQFNLKIEGLMSHFGMADFPDNVNTQKQLKKFLIARKILAAYSIYPHYIDICASNGINNAEKLNNPGNTARSGLCLFGISTDTKLKPVLKFISTVIQIKILDKGDKVGYDFTFTAPKKTKIAILPAGYNEGIDRGLSNKGYVTIAGKDCRILGRVSMNLTTIDVSQVKDISVGQEVTVYSDDINTINSINNSAKFTEKIPYELLIHLHPTIKRVTI